MVVSWVGGSWSSCSVVGVCSWVLCLGALVVGTGLSVFENLMFVLFVVFVALVCLVRGAGFWRSNL